MERATFKALWACKCQLQTSKSLGGRKMVNLLKKSGWIDLKPGRPSDPAFYFISLKGREKIKEMLDAGEVTVREFKVNAFGEER